MPVTDIVAGTEIARSPAYLAALRTALDDAALVLLAEPYLLPALEAVDADVPWIYDAFNVEADLKAGALPRSDLGQQLLADVTAIEGRAVTGAAAVTTCSIEDARELAFLHHRPLDDFTVVPNGTDCARTVPSPRGAPRPPRPLAGQVGPHAGPARAARAARGVLRELAPTEPRRRHGSSCGWPRSSPRCSS